MRFLIVFILFSCASTNSEMKYSKKLIKDGHSSLYKNGAFKLPHSSVKLIPSGPEVFNIPSQFIGGSARNSYLKAVEKANESFHIIKKGSLKSYQVSKKASYVWKDITNKIRKDTRKNSIWLMEKSAGAAIGLSYGGYQLSLKNAKKLNKEAGDLPKKALGVTKEFSQYLEEQSLEYNKEMSKRLETNLNTRSSGKTFKTGRDDFVIGYLGMFENINSSFEQIKHQDISKSFNNETKNSEKFRKKVSDYHLGILRDSYINYFKNINDSLEKAKNELSGTNEFGLTFSLFKSVGWLVDAGLWQGLIKPISKMTYASAGYVVTNGVIYPIMVLGSGTKASTSYVVEYTKFAGESIYHIFAPSIKLIVASVLSSGQAVIEQTNYAATKTLKPVGKALIKSTEIVSNSVIKVSAQGAKIVTKYVLVPTTVVSTNALSSSAGVIVGSVGATSSVAYGIGGEVVSATSGVVRGVTLVGGTAVGSAASSAYGAGVMLYHRAYSVVVPSSISLGSGVVLTYGMLAQLSSHTILAMGDVAYVVLSLEGPKWVLYGIKGKVDKSDYQQGTIINLKKLQQEGEVIKKIELSDEEVQRIFPNN